MFDTKLSCYYGSFSSIWPLIRFICFLRSICKINSVWNHKSLERRNTCSLRYITLHSRWACEQLDWRNAKGNWSSVRWIYIVGIRFNLRVLSCLWSLHSSFPSLIRLWRAWMRYLPEKSARRQIHLFVRLRPFILLGMPFTWCYSKD